MVADAVLEHDELLRTDELLVEARLTGVAARGDEPPRLRVRCGRPLLYPLATTDLPIALRGRAAASGVRYLGALFAFDLDEPPAGYRYAAARFAVDLGPAGPTAVLVHSGGDQFGLLADGPVAPVAERAEAAVRPGVLRRLLLRADRPSAWTTGEQTSVFGWRYQDRRAAPLLPRTYAVHAVLEVPAAATELRGTFEAEVELAGPIRRRLSTSERVALLAPLPGPPSGRAAAVRLCMAADVAGYSTRGFVAAEKLQRDLVRILADGRSRAGVDPSQVAPQPQGDGQFTVLPVGLDEAAAIPHLLRGVGEALAARNAVEPNDRMRLRLALHRGLVKEADNGWVGRAAVAVHRILDSAQLRGALTEHPAADYTLGVPDVLFSDVLAAGDDPPPGAFRAVTIDLPTKGFLEQAWIYVPGVAV